MNRKLTNVDVAEDEVEVNDVEDHELKEEEDDDVQNGDVEEEEEDDDVEDGHVEAQDRTHTLCEPAKSKRHVNISQEPFCTEIDRKSAAAQNLGAHFVRACAVEIHTNISQEPLYTEIYLQAE